MADEVAHVEGRDQSRRVIWGAKAVGLTAAWVAVLVVLGLYQVWQRHQIHLLGVELSTQTLRYRAAYEENRKLRLELASVKHVDRVRDEAEKRLGMRIPAPQDLVEIR